MTSNNQPRLLHVLRNDALGGLEHSTYNVVRYLADEGIRQDVLFLNPLSGGISQKFADLGIPTHSLPFRKRTALTFIINYLRLVLAIKPEVLLINGAFGLHALLAALARLAGVKRCWTYLIMAPALSGLPHYVQKAMAHIARPFTSGEFSVSDYLGGIFARHMGLPRTRIHTVYRWRDLPAISQRAEQARATRDESNTLSLCAAGRLDWMKDWPTLLKAAAMASEKIPRIRFDIAGDGQRQQELEALCNSLGIREWVHFHGYVTDMPDFLGRADIFLFATSAIEGMGNVLVESMAAGTAIISPDIGPAREVLDGGNCSLLVEAGNAAACCDAILQLADVNQRTALTQAAKRFVYSRYTAQTAGAMLKAQIFPHLATDARIK